MCIDSQEVQNLMGRISDRRITTYGLSPQADIRADNISVEGQKTLFDVVISDRRLNQVREIQGFSLPMLGQHNLQNALAAIAAGLQVGVTDEAIKQALSEFGGVKRRFTLTGEWQGVEVYDDYAHHPVEINAVLESARAAATGKGGESQLLFNRIVTPVCVICLRISAQRLMMLIASLLRRSFRLEKHRLRVLIPKLWSLI